MIALSIRQPWARVVVEGVKNVENRSWPCPEKHVGQSVLIHASTATVHVKDAFSVLAKMLHKFPVGHVEPMTEGACWYNGYVLHLGGIVGVATIVACVRDHNSEWAEPGMFHWLLAYAKPLPFFPCKGRLGFFEVSYPHEVPA